MEIGPSGRAVPHVRLVITPSRAQRPRPATAAISLVCDVMLLKKRCLRLPIEAIANGAELVGVRSGESMTEGHVTIGRYAQQAKPGTARIRFAHSLVDLF